MAYEILNIEGGAVFVRISQQLRVADQAALQAVALDLIRQGKKLKLLAITEEFQGWEKSEDWADVGFLTEYGDEVLKIALVGEERWRDEAYLFLGKGLRATEIAFFPSSELSQAEAWLRA